jgi:hypothetical protein
LKSLEPTSPASLVHAPGRGQQARRRLGKGVIGLGDILSEQDDRLGDEVVVAGPVVEHSDGFGESRGHRSSLP